jgi:hypothetical protein
MRVMESISLENSTFEFVRTKMEAEAISLIFQSVLGGRNLVSV